MLLCLHPMKRKGGSVVGLARRKKHDHVTPIASGHWSEHCSIAISVHDSCEAR